MAINIHQIHSAKGASIFKPRQRFTEEPMNLSKSFKRQLYFIKLNIISIAISDHVQL